MGRPYRLSEEGRRRLRASIQRSRPWTHRTKAGLARSAQNSRTHGRYSREHRIRRAEIRWLKAVQAILHEGLRSWLAEGGTPSPGRSRYAPHARADRVVVEAVSRARNAAWTVVKLGGDESGHMADFLARADHWLKAVEFAEADGESSLPTGS